MEEDTEQVELVEVEQVDRAPHPLCATLRQLRRAAGLTLIGFQEKFGMPSVVVGAYERGDREPPLRKLDALFGCYGYRLAIVPIGMDFVRLPGDIVADLRAIADQLEARDQADESNAA